MEFLSSSQPVPQPQPPPPSPSLSNADITGFIVNVVLAVVANPLILVFILLMVYALRRCFIRCREDRRTYPVPDDEIEAPNLDNDHDHDRVHPSPSYDYSGTAYVEEQMLKEVDMSFVFDKSLVEEAGVVLKGNINECVICLEDIKDGEIARVLPACTHVFHRACIDSWFRNKLVCPICRARPYHSSCSPLIN